jgi:hypothetical protein
LEGNCDECFNKTIIGGWKKQKVKEKAVQRKVPTDFDNVQQFFSKSYNCNHPFYAIIIAVIERNTSIDEDPEADSAVNLRFFVLKTLLEKQTKALAIDNTKPGIQFEIPQNSFAVHGVPLCRDGNTWDFRKAENEHALWIPWNEIIVTPDMVDPT